MKRNISRIISPILGVSVLVVMLGSNYWRDARNEARNNMAKKARSSIGVNMNVGTIDGVNVAGPPALTNSKTLYLVISPTCPHCKNALHILQENKTLYDSMNQVLNIVPVFPEKAPLKAAQQMLEENNIKLPVYRVRNCEVIEGIHVVPTFILTDNNRVANITSGGFSTAKDLKLIVNDIIQKSSLSTASY